MPVIQSSSTPAWASRLGLSAGTAVASPAAGIQPTTVLVALDPPRPAAVRGTPSAHAHRSAGRSGLETTPEPIVCALLSFFLPGVGQMFCKQIAKGIVGG